MGTPDFMNVIPLPISGATLCPFSLSSSFSITVFSLWEQEYGSIERRQEVADIHQDVDNGCGALHPVHRLFEKGTRRLSQILAGP
uniref:Uncharacterized protein n=1 Tax=Physcomitrium patens TaxID=3218 RepID=A0A2K1IUV6_PHYPA|nr:hypothetical protein PHYPA_025006 [Physcomitrium patens]